MSSVKQNKVYLWGKSNIENFAGGGCLGCIYKFRGSVTQTEKNKGT